MKEREMNDPACTELNHQVSRQKNSHWRISDAMASTNNIKRNIYIELPCITGLICIHEHSYNLT